MTNSPEEIIRDSEILVISHNSDEFRTLVEQIKKPVTIIDLARTLDGHLPDQVNYEGISW